jgi:hypothetical protein
MTYFVFARSGDRNVAHGGNSRGGGGVHEHSRGGGAREGRAAAWGRQRDRGRGATWGTAARPGDRGVTWHGDGGTSERGESKWIFHWSRRAIFLLCKMQKWI